MSELKYKGFTGSIDASIEDGCLVGEVLFINDQIVYEGETVTEIKAAFETAIDQYLDYCKRNDKQASKPYSGSFNVRPGPELHRLAAKEAYMNGVSLNEYVIQSIKNNITGNYAKANTLPANYTNWANIAVVNPNQTSGQAINQTFVKQPNDIFNTLVAEYTH